MKNKTSLLLMEQLVMVLTFALAAALCLGVFAAARNMSEDAEALDGAVILAQNAAEVLKDTCGDAVQAQALAESPYRLEIREMDAVPGLGQAEIRVYAEEELLFAITAGWQEVGAP